MVSVPPAEVPGAPSLDSADFDVVVSVLLTLARPLDLLHVGATCKMLRSAVHDALPWRNLLERYSDCMGDASDHGCLGSASALEVFKSRWVASQGFVSELESTLSPASSNPTPCSSAQQVVTCMSRSCEAGVLGVKYEQYALGVSIISDGLMTGNIAPADLVDWFHSGAADHQPIRGLALLGALHQLSCDVDGKGDARPDPALDRAKAAALQDLTGGSLTSLRQQVVIKYSTWSQGRDCRGFRSRDDVHRLRANLRTLGEEPEHPSWEVLVRGIINEVRTITILVGDQ